MQTGTEAAAIKSHIKEVIKDIPKIWEWDELSDMLEKNTSGGSSWLFPLDACQALGGERADATLGAVVVAFLFGSVHLVDDLIDEDPQGIYHVIGSGAAANMALALQSLATHTLGKCGLEYNAESRAHRKLGNICFGTAFGQMLDSRDLSGEEAYWRVVNEKTPPLFSFALFLGALMGGASVDHAEKVSNLGMTLGKLIQISDDVHDSLSKPAKPDWKRKSTNLPILYALTADHPHKKHFEKLLPLIHNPNALEEAQEILITSGALSYSVYCMIESFQSATSQIDQLALPCPAALEALFEHQIKPLRALLESVGVKDSEKLFH